MTEDFRTEELLFMTRKIGLDLTAQIELCFKSENMSGVQAYFMVYILRHHPEGTYLTELSHEIGVSKSTLSALIKKLREKGYLYFQENPCDVRKKKVLPTEKLKTEGNAFLQKAEKMETEICSVLSRQEKTQLWELEQKLLAQLSRMEHDETKTDRRFIYREKSFATAQTV